MQYEFMNLLILALLATIGVAQIPKSKCFNGQFHTDTNKRNVYRCVGAKWSFHGKLLRPRNVEPMKVLMALRCENNPNLHGAISGFTCNAKTDLNLLYCVNNKYQYICMNNEWKLYRLPNLTK